MLRNYHFTISPSADLTIKATSLDDALTLIKIIFGENFYKLLTSNNDFFSFYISIPD